MSEPPTSWKSDRLKDVAAINAATLAADTDAGYEFDYLEISNVDYYGIIAPDAIERLRYEDSPSRARRRVAKNSTVISSVRPNLQAAAFMSNGRGDLICSTGFNVVNAREARLASKFAYYALISENARQYFESNATGVGYPAVGDRAFNSLQIHLPPLAEQRCIAAYLERNCATIDAAVTIKRRQLEALDALRLAITMRAVTFGLLARPSLRVANQDWITEIPSHWNLCRVKRVLARMDYGISESTVTQGRYPVLKMGHLSDGEISFWDLDYVDEVGDALLLEKGDILYNRTNSADQVGKAAIFRKTKADQVTFASYLVRLRVNHRADPGFLNYVLNSDGFLGFARRLAIPSVQQSNLNSTRYSRLFVPLPPRPEQEKICAHLDEKHAEAKGIARIIESQIETLIEYRKSLIHECVTGQRRITEADLRRTPGQNVIVIEDNVSAELVTAEER